MAPEKSITVLLESCPPDRTSELESFERVAITEELDDDVTVVEEESVSPRLDNDAVAAKLARSELFDDEIDISGIDTD